MSVLRFLKLGFLGARAIVQSLADKFDDLLSSEETAGNDNVFYNPQDLTSLKIGRDGSGGSPAVGDPVGMMLDTSGLSGSMEEFLGGQTDALNGKGTFDNATDWSASASSVISGGQATISGGGSTYALRETVGSLEVGKFYEVSFTIISNSTTDSKFHFSEWDPMVNTFGLSPGSYSFVMKKLSSTSFIWSAWGTGDLVIDNLTVKEIPGNHAIAPSDAARPTLMDDPDTTWSSLTDDGTRGPELITNGTFDTDSDWTKALGATIANGVASLPGGGGQVNQSLGTLLEIGAEYEVTYTASNKTGGGSARVSLGSATGTLRSSEGTYTETLRPLDQGIVVIAYLGGSGADNVDIDNISVRKVNTAFDSQPHLVTGDDSTFDTDTGNWTKGTGWSIGSGVASCDGTQVSTSNFGQNIGMVADRWYKFTFYISSISAGQIRFNAGGSTPGAWFTTTGWKTEILRTNAAPLYIQADSSFVGSIDNVIVQELPSTTPTSYYLDTDGTDDWMQVTPTLNLGEQWWHTGAWQGDASGDCLFATSNTFRGGSQFISTYGWYNPSSVFTATSTSSPLTKNVLTVEQSDTNSLSMRYNGVQEVESITPYDDSGNPQGLALFSAQNNAFNNGLDGRFYGGAWGQGQVDYDELTTLQDYLGTLVEPDINPTDVTSYANVYEMLSAQTAAALFDIDDTTSLRVGRDGSGGVPVDGDPVGLMMDVSGAGGGTMAAYLAGAAELVTNGTFDSDTSGWTATSCSIANNAGVMRITDDDGGIGYVSQTVTLEVGKAYKMSADIVTDSITGVMYLNMGTSEGSGQMGSATLSNGTGTISAIFVATQTNGYLNLRNASAVAGEFWEVDNISVKALPGYVATAPSDAARPTLASVLDETASELTDDGTRGDELSTTTLPVTYAGAGVAVGSMLDAETGANYEITYTISEVTGSPGVFVSEILNPWKYQNLAATVGTHTYTLQANDAGAGSILYTDATSGSITFSNISIKKVQTVFDGRGDELVTNGDFSDGSAWALTPGATISGGEGVFTSATTSNGFRQDILEIGKTYEITFDVTEYTSGAVRPYAGASGIGTSVTAVGSYSQILVCATDTRLALISIGTTTAKIDNISVKEVLTPNLLLTSAGDDDSTFDTDTGNWTKGTNTVISGGVLQVTATGGTASDISVTLTDNAWYKVTGYVTVTAGSTYFALGGNTGAAITTTGWHTQYLQAGTNDRFWFSVQGGFTGSLDNIIIQEVPASVARAYYLDFDGVDDTLILDGTDFGSSTNATLYKTFRGDTADTQQIMFATDTTGTWALVAGSGDPTTNLSSNLGTPVFRQDGAVKTYTNWANVFTELIDNTDHTIGVEEADLTVSALWASNGFAIGGEFDTTYDSTGRLYSWAAVDTRLDGRNRDLLENFMISKKP